MKPALTRLPRPSQRLPPQARVALRRRHSALRLCQREEGPHAVLLRPLCGAPDKNSCQGSDDRHGHVFASCNFLPLSAHRDFSHAYASFNASSLCNTTSKMLCKCVHLQAAVPAFACMGYPFTSLWWEHLLESWSLVARLHTA